MGEILPHREERIIMLREILPCRKGRIIGKEFRGNGEILPVKWERIIGGEWDARDRLAIDQKFQVVLVALQLIEKHRPIVMQ
jgi:hypothetical protein